MEKLNTFGWVVIATEEILEHGVRSGKPRGRPGWSRQQCRDFSAALGAKCPPEFVGKGLWREWEHDEEFDRETHALSPAEWVVDSENKRLVRTRTAVALTQAEIDARDASAAAAAAQQLASRRDELLTKVSADAEKERARYLTPGDHKSNEYAAKRDEVKAFLAAKAAAAPSDPTYTEAEYPWAYAAALALNGDEEPSTAQIKAQIELFATRATAWEAIGQRIGALETAAKVQIAAAHDAGNAVAMEAAAVVPWPTPGGGQ